MLNKSWYWIGGYVQWNIYQDYYDFINVISGGDYLRLKSPLWPALAIWHKILNLKSYIEHFSWFTVDRYFELFWKFYILYIQLSDVALEKLSVKCEKLNELNLKCCDSLTVQGMSHLSKVLYSGTVIYHKSAYKLMPNKNKRQNSYTNWFNNPVDSVISTISWGMKVFGLTRN